MKTKKIIFVIFCCIIISSVAQALLINYSYDNAGRLTKIDYAGNGAVITYDYDSNGNLLQRETSPVPEPGFYLSFIIGNLFFLFRKNKINMD